MMTWVQISPGVQTIGSAIETRESREQMESPDAYLLLALGLAAEIL